MKRSFLVLALGLACLAFAPYPGPRAAASCAGPYLKDVDHLVLTRGASAAVEGRAFVHGCSDSIGCTESWGCQDCTEPAPENPAADVELSLEQRGRTWRLATADAGSADDNRLGWIIWTFTVPRHANPGPAKLVAEGTSPVRILLR